MNTLRYNGIYRASTSPLHFRVYEDGRAEGRFFDTQPDPRVAAANLGPGVGGYASGSFELTSELVVLQLTFPFGNRRYEGRVVGAGIELKFVQEGKDNPTKLYAFHELSESDLEAPQATRAHLLRGKLSDGGLDRTRVEAAAAIGDPVAMLAVQTYLEIARISKVFAGLGSNACLRLLLALSWSEDGLWYTPKQGVVQGASRKDDEGKTLRALAKWCLKPDDKILAKAEQEFAEVIKVGPAFKFLDAALRVIKAADDAGRSAAMTEALTLHLAQDPPAAFETARAQVVPWLLGIGDPLADVLQRLK